MTTILMIWGLLLAPAAEAQDSALTLRVDGLSSMRGHVMCTLYADADTWLQDPGFHATVSAEPASGSATCVFPDVPAGVWAVSFIHDLNDNQDMDSNFFGLPKEPWGISRDAPVRFGPPAFADASFRHPSAVAQVAHLR